MKNPPDNAGDRDTDGSLGRRSPGEGHGNPLQYSRLKTPIGRGAWRATVHGVAESDTTRSNLARTRMLKVQAPAPSTLSHAWNLDWLSVSHVIIYMFRMLGAGALG